MSESQRIEALEDALSRMIERFGEQAERLSDLESDRKRVAIPQVRAEPVVSVRYRFVAPTKKNPSTGIAAAKYVCWEQSGFAIIDQPTPALLTSTRERRVLSNNEEVTPEDARALIGAGFAIAVSTLADGVPTATWTARTPEQLDGPNEGREQ